MSSDALNFTVLYRENGTWYKEEVTKLVDRLVAQTIQQKDCPEYLILHGHHTKAETLKALGGGASYTVTRVTGRDSPELPFSPCL